MICPKRFLYSHMVSGWPKLAWVASFKASGPDVDIYHGTHVETGDSWACEAVWDAEFDEAGFDLTDLVFGTGVRLREGMVVFVSAGTMMDRLWHCQSHNQFHVSNSLPCLLAQAGVSLKDDYFSYTSDIRTQCLGLNKYQRTIPAEPCDLHITYLNNLVFDGQNIVEESKPDLSPDFSSYADYYEFLVDTAKRLRINMESCSRRFNISPLASVSKGYDSCAAALVARHAGCEDAVTITNASSLIPRSDSGKEIADQLGLTCHEYRHVSRDYREEEEIWSVAGEPAGLNLSIFNYSEPLCLFFTGYRGDTTWCMRPLLRNGRQEPFAGHDVAGLGLCEIRLVRGLFHCVVPFWGSSKAEQLNNISNSPGMAPWRVGGDYDRPIPRRMLEDAGVSRDSFGIRKNATFAARAFFWPFGQASMASFREYLQRRGLCAPGRGTIWWLRKFAGFDQLVSVNLSHVTGRRFHGLRPYINLQGQKLLFQWANDTLKKRHSDALSKACEKNNSDFTGTST